MGERVGKSVNTKDGVKEEVRAPKQTQHIHSYFPNDLNIFRKASCACGGGCPSCQAKSNSLRISHLTDAAETEADRIADDVMASPLNSAVSHAPFRIQRLSLESKGHAGSAPPSVDKALAGPGKPLEGALRQEMEQHFDQDFSSVRVHTGADGEQSARDVNAQAYTAGNDIVFGSGRFEPATHEGRRLIAHELTHVVQQAANPFHGLHRSPDGDRDVAVESPLDKPADQVVRGVTYHPVWDGTNQVWDFVDETGHSLNSTVVEGKSRASLEQFWSAVVAVQVTEQAKKLSDEAVDRLVREQGPRVKELQSQIAEIERKIAESDQEGVIVGGRTQAIRALQGQIQEIVEAYDPSVERSSPVLFRPMPFLELPYSTSEAPLHGPPTPGTVEQMAYKQNAAYAGDIVPEKGVRFGTYGGADWTNKKLRSDAILSQVGNAHAYDIETNAVQVANDLERLARSGLTEIHLATGVHGDAIGGTSPEPDFGRQDLYSIVETMQRHPGLKIIPYDMADPIQAAHFDAMQELAAESRLPGGATLAAHCFSCSRVPDPHPAPAGPYGTAEYLNGGPSAASYVHGGASVAFGGLGIYGGLQDPNRTIGALKVAGGTAQVVGGSSYLLGHASDSVSAVRFGSRLGTFGGYAGGALALVDFYREMQNKFEPGVQPLEGEEALYGGIDASLKLAGIIYPGAAIAAIGLQYGVTPVAQKASEYLTPMFVEGISQAYGIPSEIVWKMH
jgi:hypothetical protein